MNRFFLKAIVPIALVALLPMLSSAGPKESSQAGKPAAALDLTALKSVGSKSAPITIEVFSDYQCPQCRIFYLETARQLMQTYIPAGKVYYVHRDFPLSMHSHSREAARWASAAALAGVFETAEQTLYTKQEDWGSTGKIDDALSSAISAADMKKVRTIEATQGPQIDAAIASDMALGNSRGVNGTPTIYVFHKGQMTPLPPGGVNYSLLKQYIDYLLQQH